MLQELQIFKSENNSKNKVIILSWVAYALRYYAFSLYLTRTNNKFS